MCFAHVWTSSIFGIVSPTFHFAVSVSCDDLQDTTPGPVGCSVNPPSVSHDHEDLFIVHEGIIFSSVSLSAFAMF